MKQLTIDKRKTVREVSEGMRGAQLCGQSGKALQELILAHREAAA